ncbi:MAG: 23S rRNA (guanosine(2251)-2'-O)-methyltransferase RlmB [Defluviitaleaceae bacterium]|nr:23S rRNA (guanosine(2251)-2'-O)-methyltransferase RlmB [Defluviitaleaceae bacterium]
MNSARNKKDWKANRKEDKRENRTEKRKENRMDDDWIETLQLEGRKGVLEALNHNKPIDRLLLKKEADGSVNGTLKVIAAKAKELGIVVQAVDRAKLDSIAQSSNHQGVIALCPAKEYVEVQDILNIAAEKGEPPFILVLDGISDPHNFGAILRTADAGGVHGVVIPKRRAVGLTGAVAKTSAGAIEHVPVARVTNIGRIIDDLKTAGLWVLCGDGGRDDNDSLDGTSLYDKDFSGPIALVIGAEGAGVSRLVREKSDIAVRIPMLGQISSLNASVAAGIMIYEVVRSRLSRL